MDQNVIVSEQSIQNKIYTIRGMQVMLDRDLAKLYGVETKRINEAVKNNPDKFPDLRSKISTSSLGGTRYAQIIGKKWFQGNFFAKAKIAFASFAFSKMDMGSLE